jgi:hypothetical protein
VETSGTRTAATAAASGRVVGMESGDQQRGCGCGNDEDSTQHGFLL